LLVLIYIYIYTLILGWAYYTNMAQQTQKKNIVLHTKANSMIQDNHLSSNNSIFLNTIPLTCHFGLDAVRRGMPTMSQSAEGSNL
jgi:hypothetical protein